MHKYAALFAMTVLLFVAACGDDDLDLPATVGELCASVSDSVCARVLECFPESTTQPQCTAQGQDLCCENDGTCGVAVQMQFTLQQYDACLIALRNQECNQLAMTPSACEPIIPDDDLDRFAPLQSIREDAAY